MMQSITIPTGLRFICQMAEQLSEKPTLIIVREFSNKRLNNVVIKYYHVYYYRIDRLMCTVTNKNNHYLTSLFILWD